MPSTRAPALPAEAEDRGPAARLVPPLRVRIRSAVVLAVIMGALGVLVASLVLAVVLVVVQALAGL